MMNFLRDVDSYFRSKPWLFFSILGVLSLFLITTIVLSVVCPPAALAIGIGAWSLIGNILPLVALSLFVTFTLCTMATQIPRMVSSPTDDLVEVLGALASVSSQIAGLKKNLSNVQPEKQASENLSMAVNYDPLFVPVNDVEKNKITELLQTSHLPATKHA